MGDKAAQLVFEKTKTPAIKEMNSVEETDRGNREFGSTRVKTTSELVESETKIKSISKISVNEKFRMPENAIKY